MKTSNDVKNVSTAGMGILIFAAMVIVALLIYWFGMFSDILAERTDSVAYIADNLKYIL